MPQIKNDNTLPQDFGGIFPFTNASDMPLKCKWNNVEYTFPAMSTSPMIISNATPEEVQHIRKKFAREYAEREFYKSGRFQELDAAAPKGSGNVPAIYSEADLQPYIQQCLEPLPAGRATAQVLARDSSDNYRKDETGANITVPLDKNMPLVKAGAEVMVD